MLTMRRRPSHPLTMQQTLNCILRHTQVPAQAFAHEKLPGLAFAFVVAWTSCALALGLTAADEAMVGKEVRKEIHASSLVRHLPP